MRDDTQLEHEEHRLRHEQELSVLERSAATGTQAAEIVRAHAPSLLRDPLLATHANAPVRATAMHAVQQTLGNRALQRYVQREIGPSLTSLAEPVLGPQGPIPIPYPSGAMASPGGPTAVGIPGPQPATAAGAPSVSRGDEAGALREVLPPWVGALPGAGIGALLGGTFGVQRSVQRSAAGGDPSNDDELARRIEESAGSGGTLEPRVQQRLERSLGADLSGVHVHTGPEADHLSNDLEAVAFTTGQDIFFSEGTYRPDSPDGLRLIAHEVAHTVQQAHGPVDGTPLAGGVSVSDPSDRFEQAADMAAETVVRGRAARAAPTPAQRVPLELGAPGVQRVAVQRFGWEDISALGSSALDYISNSRRQERAGEQVRDIEDGAQAGLARTERRASGWLSRLANDLTYVPAVGDAAATTVRHVVEPAMRFAGGAAGGAVDMATGIAGVAANPIGTARGVADIAGRLNRDALGDPTLGDFTSEEQARRVPGDLTVTQIGEALTEDMREDTAQGNLAGAAGRAFFDVGTLMLPALDIARGISSAGRAAQVPRALAQAGRAGRAVAEVGEAAPGVRAAGQAGEGARAAGTAAPAVVSEGEWHVSQILGQPTPNFPVPPVGRTIAEAEGQQSVLVRWAEEQGSSPDALTEVADIEEEIEESAQGQP